MKRVLIIANLVHASPRIPGFAVHLPRFGWEATIVTPPFGTGAEEQLGFPRHFLERVRIVPAPYRGDVLWPVRALFRMFGFSSDRSITEQVKSRAGIKSRRSVVERLLTLYQSIFGYPDTEKGWLRPALRVARSALTAKRFDAVLSSSPYPTSHFVARRLKAEYAVPWLADFRDPWSQNHAYPYGPLWRFLDTRLEKKTVSTADAVTAASPAYAKKQAKLHGRDATPITNGFDPDLAGGGAKLTKTFSITYTGSIYPGKQNPEPLFAALVNLLSAGTIKRKDIEVRFFGAEQAWLQKLIDQFGLGDVAQQHGRIGRRESYARQRESQVLVLFGWEGPEERGVYPLKTFEYLAARRPILVTGGMPGEGIQTIVRETGAGVGAHDIEATEAQLKEFYREYRESGAVRYRGDAALIERYSYRAVAGQFAKILDRITQQ